jgi:malate dehydrogenase
VGLRAGILTFWPGGVGIVSLLRSQSAFYAPSAASAKMVEAIIMLDQKRVLPWAAYLQDEYDLNDLFVGVPVKIGESGIEEVVELEL